MLLGGTNNYDRSRLVLPVKLDNSFVRVLDDAASIQRDVDDCPSSDDLRHIAGFQKGGSGSSVIRLCGM